MKSKKGFTLVELLAVIAILAILVIIAIPNVLNLYRNARENVFVNEVQNIIRTSQQAYVTNSLTNKSKTCFDSKTNPLDVDAKSSLKYKVELSNNGKIISIQVMDNNYQLIKTNASDIKRDDIGNSRSNKTIKIETRQEGVGLTACDGTSIEEGKEIEDKPDEPTVDEYFEGSGTEEDPFKIQYIEDLIELSERVNSGETFENKVFKLMNNLDFQNEENYKDAEINKDIVTTGSGFTPIGKEATPFSGTFDGNSNRIDNLYIHNTDVLDSEMFSFIAYLKNGEVINLTIEGEITTDVKIPLGGIVGQINDSIIDNCVNEVIVTNKTDSYPVGGIAGWSIGNSTIKNSINKSNIFGGSYTAGIIAGNQGGTLTIENCKNYGTITNELGFLTSGLIGQNINDNVTKTIMKNSINYGEIIGKSTDTTLYLGGLIGRSTKELEIDNSNNEGKITIDSNSGFYAGGLVGYISGKVNINNSHNKNTITTSKISNAGGRTIGGLVGQFTSTQTSIITNSSNEKAGEISGGNRTGGLVGECQAGLIMNNSYNLAKITSGDTWLNNYTHIGGLIGDTSGWSTKHEDIVILNSYNIGNIEANIDNYNSQVGGLVGRQVSSTSSNQEDTRTNTKIINSYNQGNITMNGNTTGELTANGIIYVEPKSVTLNNVYNTGSLNSIKTNNVITNNDSSVTTNYKNVYYLNTLTGTKPEDTTNVIGKTASEMKNATFVSTLNTNKSSITLTDIDDRLTGYTLCDWKLGVSGYPELDCK